MAEEQDKKDEEKLEFDSAGQPLGYISLDQARVLAMRTARENTGFYGEVYGQQDLVWNELSAEESKECSLLNGALRAWAMVSSSSR